MPSTLQEHRPAGRTASGARVVHARGRRTLTGVGAVTLGCLAALVGLVLDAAVSGGPGGFFGALLCLGAVAATLGVRRVDVRTSVVMVPLIYAGGLVVSALLLAAHPGSGLDGRAALVFTDAVENAPSLFVATGLAAALAVWRARREPLLGGAGSLPSARVVRRY